MHHYQDNAHIPDIAHDIFGSVTIEQIHDAYIRCQTSGMNGWEWFPSHPVVHNVTNFVQLVSIHKYIKQNNQTS